MSLSSGQNNGGEVGGGTKSEDWLRPNGDRAESLEISSFVNNTLHHFAAKI